MNAVQVVVQAAITAAELFALATTPPALADHYGPMSVVAAVPAASVSRVELTDADAGRPLRVRQHLVNRSGKPFDLAGVLPLRDDRVIAARVTHSGRVVDLLGDEPCAALGDDAHVRLAFDEVIADALMLPPGESADIEIAFAEPVAMPSGLALALRSFGTAEQSQVFALEGDEQAALVVVSGPVRGRGAVQLRPTGAAAQRIELGELDGALFVIPLADRSQLQALRNGAVEIEIRTQDSVIWSTVAVEQAQAPIRAMVVE